MMEVRRAGCRNSLWIGTVVCGLAACGAGESANEGGTGGAQFDAKPLYTDADIDHLMARTHFGGTAAERDAARSMGLRAYVDQMLTLQAVDSTAVEQDARALLVNGTDPVGQEGQFPSRTQLARWWLHVILRTENPVQERLALFWHEHFATSSEVLDGSRRRWMVDHVNTLRAQACGSFSDLVLAMARDGAMLIWLDGASSTRTAPNENFAREFFELFTVGVDQGYDQDDINEAARAFTGYRSRFDSGTGLSNIEFDPERKDQGFKVLFDDVVLRSNPSTEDDFALVVDATFARLDPAPFVAQRMLEAFCMEDPPQDAIDGLAAVIRSEDYDMGQVFRTLFLSELFYSAASREGLVRDPLDYAVGFARSTGLMIEADDFEFALRDLAMVPTQPPSVNGWPEHDEWLSAQAMVERANFVRRCIVERTWQDANGYGVAMPAGVTDPEAVITHFADLLGVTLSENEAAQLTDFLNTDVRSGGERVADPFDVADAEHVDERVRGALYVLAQHPTALVR